LSEGVGDRPAGLQNVAVGDAPGSYGEFAVNQSVDAKALGILPNSAKPALEVRS